MVDCSSAMRPFQARSLRHRGHRYRSEMRAASYASASSPRSSASTSSARRSRRSYRCPFTPAPARGNCIDPAHQRERTAHNCVREGFLGMAAIWAAARERARHCTRERTSLLKGDGSEVLRWHSQGTSLGAPATANDGPESRFLQDKSPRRAASRIGMERRHADAGRMGDNDPFV